MLRAHCVCASRSEYHAVRAVIEGAIDTHTQTHTHTRGMTQNPVRIPENRKHSLGRVKGADVYK